MLTTHLCKLCTFKQISKTPWQKKKKKWKNKPTTSLHTLKIKIEAEKTTTSTFSQNGVLWTDFPAWNGTLAKCRRGVQRESSGPNIPIGLPPFLNQCPTEISLSSFKLYCPAAMFKCIRTPFSSEKPYNCATFRTEEDKGNRPNLLLQFKISMCKGNMRPVPTKWETSHKNPFPRYDQVQNGILHVMVAAL